MQRTGLIVQKLGMSRLFSNEGEPTPVTVLYLDGCQVVAHRTQEKNGYVALQVGVKQAKPQRLSKALRGYFSSKNLEPWGLLSEFRVSPEAMVDIGSHLSVAHFCVGQYVDASGISIGKGFAGPMKRHGFRGLRATHGVSVSHRSHGSTGNRTLPGRVFKNKKMAGRMGGVQVTVQNLCVMDVDKARGLIVVRGAVPGPKYGFLRLTDAVKKSRPETAPLPAAILDDVGQAVSGDRV